jgi:hypothetical protein
MRFLSSIRIVRVTLAFAVAFWMAGGGCMLGCENMASATAAEATHAANDSSPEKNTSNIVVAADACASMQSHGCCAKRGNQPAARGHVNSSAKRIAKPADNSAHSSRHGSAHSSRNSSSPNAAMPPTASGIVVVPALLAPFTSMMNCPLAVNATAALSKARPDDTGGDLLPSHTTHSFTFCKEQLTALTPPSLPPNRGHTYLRCCVFLI